MGSRFATLGVVVVGLALPSIAPASFVRGASCRGLNETCPIFISAFDRERNTVVVSHDLETGAVVITDAAGIVPAPSTDLNAGPNSCLPRSRTTVECRPGSQYDEFFAYLGDRDDYLEIKPGTGLTARIHGGPDDDHLRGAEFGNYIHGDTGFDTLVGSDEGDLLVGGDGHDWLRGRGGDDILRGNHGQDRLLGGPGIDRFFGDGGPDSVDARDGVRDGYLDCGPGVDEFLGDAIDPRGRSCEPYVAPVV